MTLDVISHSGSFCSSFLLLFSPHFLLHFQFNPHLSRSLSLSLSSLLSLIGWERCTSTSKTETASLFCRRGGRIEFNRQKMMELDGERLEVGGGGCQCFRESSEGKATHAHPAEMVQLLTELQVNNAHTTLHKLLQKVRRCVHNYHSSCF